MSWDEHIMLIAHTVNCFGDRILVIGNTGSNSTREALHATEQGFAVSYMTKYILLSSFLKQQYTLAIAVYEVAMGWPLN
jgi:hypothetical protein